MKILHFTNTIRRGGAERQQATIIKHSEHNELITTLHYNKKSYFEENEVIKLSGRGILKKIVSFNKIISKKKPDIVYAWSTLTFLIASFICCLRRIKVVNGSVRHGVLNRSLSGYFRMITLHFSKYVIANSEAGLRANWLKPCNNKFVLYNGKESFFSEKILAEEKRLRLKKIFPNYSNEKVFISVANLVPFKDYITIIDALLYCKKKIKFKYIILGDGPLFDMVQKYIKSRNLENDIAMMGSVTDVVYFFQIADVMLHSSKGEGISNAIVEAMFAGLPVISTNVGGVPETVFNKTSLLYNYKNVEELVKCVMKYDVLITLSEENKEELHHYLQKFSIPTMIKNYHNIIKKIAGD